MLKTTRGRKVEAIAVLMTMAEVSGATGIPVATLRYYRHLGKGPQSALLAGRVMYREQDVAKWINDQFEKEESK